MKQPTEITTEYTWGTDYCCVTLCDDTVNIALYGDRNSVNLSIERVEEFVEILRSVCEIEKGRR